MVGILTRGGLLCGPSQIATPSVREHRLARLMRYLIRPRLDRSGEADVKDEVPDPEVEYSAAGPVHDERQHDDGQDYHDHPEEEHDDAGDGIPGYSSRSSHGHQLPTDARLIQRVFTGTTSLDPSRSGPASRPDGGPGDVSHHQRRHTDDVGWTAGQGVAGYVR